MGSKKIKAIKAQESDFTKNEVASKVSFLQWFWQLEKSGKIRPHQKNEIEVYFKEVGLGGHEEVARYNEVFKSF